MLKKVIAYWRTFPPLSHLILSYFLLAPLGGGTIQGRVPDWYIWATYAWRVLMAVIVILAFLYPIKKEGFAQLAFEKVVQVLSALAVAIWVVVIMGIAW